MQHQPEAVKLWEEQYRDYCAKWAPDEAEWEEMENEIRHIKELVTHMFQFPDTYIL